jgi:hypothetical protein
LALIYLAMVSFGLSEPLFNVVTLFRREMRIGLGDVILIVIVFQYAATALLIGVRRVAGGWGRAVDLAVYTGVALSLLRQLQQTAFKTEFLGASEKFGLILAMAALAVVLVIVLRRAIDQYAVYLGALAPVFGFYFIYLMAIHPLPLGAAAEPPAKEGPPVFLVILDELSLNMIIDRNSDIDEKLFPNFRALALDSVWYRQAIANHPGTNASFPSLLTGAYRPGKSSPIFAEDVESLPPESLPRRLMAQGYRVVMAVDSFGCRGRDFKCLKYLDGGETAFPWRVFSKFAQEFGPDYLVDRWLPFLHGGLLTYQHELLQRLGAEGRPGAFYLFNILSSHAPYVFDADGKYLRSPHLRMVSGADFKGAVVNYRQQLRFLDRALGRFVAALKGSGLYDRAVIAVISDHGNCWTAECPGRVYPQRIKVIEPDLPRVPVFLRAPGLKPRTDDGDFQLIDLMPTVMDALGLPMDETTIDGRSAVRSGLPARPRPFFLDVARPPVYIGLPTSRAPAPK